MQNGQDNALLPYGKLAVCKIFNVKSEMLFFTVNVLVLK